MCVIRYGLLLNHDGLTMYIEESQWGPTITLKVNPGGRRKDRPRKRWSDGIQNYMT
jgi:hypothetical protein